MCRIALACASLLLAACSGSDSIAGGCSTASGGIAETMTSAVTAAGNVSGTLAGGISIRIDTVFPGPGGTQLFRAAHTIVTAPGDTLRTNDHGVFTPRSQTLFGVADTLEVAGGTGAYRGGTGRLTTSGTVDFASGVVALDYTGNLCHGAAADVTGLVMRVTPHRAGRA